MIIVHALFQGVSRGEEVVAVRHHLYLDVIHSRNKSITWDIGLSAARNNVIYERTFMAQLEYPTMITEEDKVIKEAQYSFRSYKEFSR